jgi:hypothetical protein
VKSTHADVTTRRFTTIDESPGWHADVLAARKAGLDAGDAQFLTAAQLEDRRRR